jgi:Na+/melibiose symporter-like transporter
MALGIIVVGLCFSLIFHLGVREKVITSAPLPRQPPTEKSGCCESKKETVEEVPCRQQEVASDHYNSACDKKKMIKWYQWFKNPQLYIIGIVYMSARLVVNLTQLYSPFFVLESIAIGKQSVAIAPLVIFISSLVTTLIVKYVNHFIGRHMTFFLGLAIIWGGLMWCWVQPSSTDSSVNGNIIYGAMVLIGAGGTTLLVTALSFISDMIGDSVSSGAFVYGLMSFADKLSNGLAIQAIQLLHPCKGEGQSVCCSGCHAFYRTVIVYVPGGASFIALGGLALLLVYIFVKSRWGKTHNSRSGKEEKSLECSCPSKCHLHIQDNDEQEHLLSKSK